MRAYDFMRLGWWSSCHSQATILNRACTLFSLRIVCTGTPTKSETKLGKSVGKPDIGGPFELIDHFGKVSLAPACSDAVTPARLIPQAHVAPAFSFRVAHGIHVSRSIAAVSRAENQRQGLPGQMDVYVLWLHILPRHLPQRGDSVSFARRADTR